MYFYLSLGSNIEPEVSAVKMVLQLCECFGVIGLFPFRYTEPEAIDSQDLFTNSLVIIWADMSPVEVKTRLNHIETAMGRDRNDPLRSVKSRSADIDILGANDVLDLSIFKQVEEGYVQSCLNMEGEMLSLDALGLASHQRPASVYLDTGTGQIRVVEDELQGFVNGGKATLDT